MAANIVWLLSALMVIATVTVHYEIIMIVSDYVVPWAKKHIHSRRVMSFAIAGLLAGHVLEIFLFALAIKLLVSFPEFGSVIGDFTGIWEDYLYLSAVNYTSIGADSIRLTGPVRMLAAGETLAGLMMIAWSASFTYLKMEMIWERRRARRD